MTRLAFVALATGLLVAGLVLRLGPWRLPLWLHHSGGGVLWGAMIYMLVAALRPPGWGAVSCLTASVLVIAAVEGVRLVHAPALDAFRTTLAGELLLGPDLLGIEHPRRFARRSGGRRRHDPPRPAGLAAAPVTCQEGGMDQITDRAAANTIPPRTMSPALKFALEMGPLLLFFFANFRPKLFEPLMRPLLPAKLLDGKEAGLFTATGVLMIAVLVALVISFAKTRKLPLMPLVTAILVVVFGALTLYFQDPRFIKMKPTILYALFGGALVGGLAFNRPLLPVMLDNAMSLDEAGWRKLTLRWGLMFLVLAGLNEFVWRTFSEHTWVLFKFPGTVILIFLFTFSQVPLIMKHELKGEAAEKAPEHL